MNSSTKVLRHFLIISRLWCLSFTRQGIFVGFTSWRDSECSNLDLALHVTQEGFYSAEQTLLREFEAKYPTCSESDDSPAVGPALELEPSKGEVFQPVPAAETSQEEPAKTR